jgi:hypothetical protein
MNEFLLSAQRRPIKQALNPGRFACHATELPVSAALHGKRGQGRKGQLPDDNWRVSLFDGALKLKQTYCWLYLRTCEKTSDKACLFGIALAHLLVFRY